jgi:hypothetical protein
MLDVSHMRTFRAMMYLMTSSKKHAVFERSACGTSLRRASSLCNAMYKCNMHG